MIKGSFICCFLSICLYGFPQTSEPTVESSKTTIVMAEEGNPRIAFGVEKLRQALVTIGYDVTVQTDGDRSVHGNRIIVGEHTDTFIREHLNGVLPVAKEGFRLLTEAKAGSGIIAGADATGTLYGCMELVERIKHIGEFPVNLDFSDQPEMVLRGTAIGVQKPYYLPGRTVYEYPYTPEVFPWLYDKEQWIRYLDMMVENRYNSLYLWNGHPFASLVKLDDYPYAVEVDEETFKRNEELFTFLTAEADKRGIWIIQMFYNIIVSKPFAEHHGIKTQDRNRPIMPLIADYTRKSIAAFVEKYPNVGLLVTLGEAMEGVGQDDVDWFTKTIIPAVQDGMKALGRDDEPPIVLRAHDTDAPRVMETAKPLYGNLYTMAKYNGEALTTYTPRGKWAELHRKLSAVAPVHIQNVHILANLEPFRYSSPDFIQKSVIAMHEVYGSNGLHLYPQASYWDWPYTADRISADTSKRLLQLDRDWMWYQAWARYAWKSKRERAAEEVYWSNVLADYYGTKTDQGKSILSAYEETGEIAPKLLRRFGITDGNRQTLTLGMFMTQFINPYKYSLFTMLYESEAPEGEMIIDEARKAWHKETHIGETPSRVASEVVAHARAAVQVIEQAEPMVTQNREEFNRLMNDVHSYEALANCYAAKVKAALKVLRYKYSHDIQDLEAAAPLLAASISHYEKLVYLTEDTYYYANSMQTPQRRIPIRAADGKYKTWKELLPLYQQEYQNFIKNIDSLKSANHRGHAQPINRLASIPVKLHGGHRVYHITEGQMAFRDDSSRIAGLAPEIEGLQGVALDRGKQINQGTSISFTSDVPVKVLVGYFIEDKVGYSSDDRQSLYAPKPTLEHDASAGDYGQEEVKISNAIAVEGLPRVNIHTYLFGAGRHTLNLPKGLCLVLGFVDEDALIRTYNAGIGVSDEDRDIDWLFD